MHNGGAGLLLLIMSLVEKIKCLEKGDKVNISFEYFAPKTEIGKCARTY